jgi:hypothetical protein
MVTVVSGKEFSGEARSARLSAPGDGRRGYRADILDIVEGAVEKHSLCKLALVISRLL